MRKSDALNTQRCGLSCYQSRKTCQPLNHYTSDSSNNSDKQWERTRAMASTAPTATLARRRTIRSTATRPTTSLVSRRIAKALARRIFFSFSRNSNPLRIHNFFHIRKSMEISITHLVIYGRFFHPWVCLPLASKL